MDRKQSLKSSGQSGFQQQQACGENLSNASTPSVQLKGTRDHNDKKPMTVRDMNIKDEPMDTGSPGGQFTDRPFLKTTDAAKPKIKDGPAGDSEIINVCVQGPGNQKKLIKICRNASIDDLISAANTAFGFGHKPSNTCIFHSGKELVSGAGETVAKAGIQNYGELNLCVRALGGHDIR